MGSCRFACTHVPSMCLYCLALCLVSHPHCCYGIALKADINADLGEVPGSLNHTTQKDVGDKYRNTTQDVQTNHMKSELGLMRTDEEKRSKQNHTDFEHGPFTNTTQKTVLYTDGINADVALKNAMNEIAMNAVTNTYLQKLFNKYGEDGVMNYKDFQMFLQSLGLDVSEQAIPGASDHNDHDHIHDDHEHNHDEVDPEAHHHSNDSAGIKRRSAVPASSEHDKHMNGISDATNSTREKSCLSMEAILALRPHSEEVVVTSADLVLLCPVLMQQLDSPVCLQPTRRHDHAHSDGDHGDHPIDDHADHHDPDHSHTELVHDGAEPYSNSTGSKIFGVPAVVWGYSLLSCTIISLVGLLAVLLIPIMHRVCYNHFLQYLVAVAVGSLSGDALLHLLPHAMTGGHSSEGGNVHLNHTAGHSDHSDHAHDLRPVWLGLTAFLACFAFFVLERMMGILTSHKRKKSSKRISSLKENEKSSPKAVPAKKNPSKEAALRLANHEGATSCEEFLMVHPNKDVRQLAVDCNQEKHLNCDPGVRDSWIGEGHSHNHGHHNHGESMPSSVSAVAWMVIMGDGLHNFSDGMAIGASFASSVSGGLSTSIAVFCHELPHELGDFAVLLRAGMSVRQALVYNLVSSVLCIVGMVIGVAIGNLDSASQWIFAMVAGMFLYIAFVDMVPELTSISPREGESAFQHLLLQIAGLLTGMSIMLVIAVFEEQIQFSLPQP